MSGPVRTQDIAPEPLPATPPPAGPTVQVTPSRAAQVDGQRVLRALPTLGRRTVGAWCFADHMASAPDAPRTPLAIGPHPHIGLQTVTWLVQGEILHRDSLGSQQLVRPGQLNLMTAGIGVAHSEEQPADGDERVHGIQLWVAQPERTRHGAPAFEHHAELPRLELPGATATVLVGVFAGAESPARRDTDHAGVELLVRPGGASFPVRGDYEHALVVLSGLVGVDGVEVAPGALAYLGGGRSTLNLTAGGEARLMLLGGVPFESPLLMWWNFVARTRDEIEAARDDWARRTGRFPAVASPIGRIEAPGLPWRVPPAP